DVGGLTGGRVSSTKPRLSQLAVRRREAVGGIQPEDGEQRGAVAGVVRRRRDHAGTTPALLVAEGERVRLPRRGHFRLPHRRGDTRGVARRGPGAPGVAVIITVLRPVRSLRGGTAE